LPISISKEAAPKSVKIKEQAGCGDEQQQSEKLA
jgi:hypothetical protein